MDRWTWRKLSGRLAGYVRPAEILRRAQILHEVNAIKGEIPQETLRQWLRGNRGKRGEFPVKAKRVVTSRGTRYYLNAADVDTAIFFLDAHRRGEDWRVNAARWADRVRVWQGKQKAEVPDANAVPVSG